MSSQSHAAAGQHSDPPAFKVVGILLAVLSGVFIGGSFVLKKKGLLRAQEKYHTTPGEGVKYLKSVMWWSGMIIMITGEACNLVAYSLAEPLVVTPMGALSVVISAVLSHYLLQEKLTLFGWLGCALCVLGAAIIGLNGGGEHGGTGDIRTFEKSFIAPGFLAWLGICVVFALILAIFVMPRWGKRYMLVPITICSTIGGLSVTMTSGVGASIVTSIRGQNQVTYWFFWLLFVLTAVTLVIEILYLNKALEVHGTAMVTATYYVLFTSMSLISTIVLNKGMNALPSQIVSLVLAFLVTCIGISILQLSKIDPSELQQEPGVDRKSTMLLQASRSYVRSPSSRSRSTHHPPREEEKLMEQDPGVETLMPGLGMGVVGSIIRARSTRSSRQQRNDVDVTASAVGRPAVFGHAEDYYALDPRDPSHPTGLEPSPPPGQTRSETLPTDEDGTKKWRLYDSPMAPPTHTPPTETAGTPVRDNSLGLPAHTIPLGLRSPPQQRQASAISWAPTQSPSHTVDVHRGPTADSALARIEDSWHEASDPPSDPLTSPTNRRSLESAHRVHDMKASDSDEEEGLMDTKFELPDPVEPFEAHEGDYGGEHVFSTTPAEELPSYG